ncbi:hypothetical protein [Paenochrobactrum glaciei]|uniref:Uncharacterized protein n=1 Tax=Paenochrobactrum glaciei TaxID=486407 RepID=A0ABP3RLM1_9HYPH
MVVFGHRGTLVARELGIKVKAVVKQLDDVSSAVAQGQKIHRALIYFLVSAHISSRTYWIGG